MFAKSLQESSLFAHLFADDEDALKPLLMSTSTSTSTAKSASMKISDNDVGVDADVDTYGQFRSTSTQSSHKRRRSSSASLTDDQKRDVEQILNQRNLFSMLVGPNASKR